MHNKKRLLIKFSKQQLVQSSYAQGIEFLKNRKVNQALSSFQDCISNNCSGLTAEQRVQIYCGLYNFTEDKAYLEVCYQDTEAFNQCSDDMQAKIHYKLGYICFDRMNQLYGVTYIFRHFTKLISMKLFEERVYAGAKTNIAEFIIYQLLDFYKRAAIVDYKIQHQTHAYYHTLKSLIERKVVNIGERESSSFRQLGNYCMFKVPMPPKRTCAKS